MLVRKQTYQFTDLYTWRSYLLHHLREEGRHIASFRNHLDNHWNTTIEVSLLNTRIGTSKDIRTGTYRYQTLHSFQPVCFARFVIRAIEQLPNLS